MILVDTCVLRYFFKGHPDAVRFIQANQSRIIVSWATVVELHKHAARNLFPRQSLDWLLRFQVFYPINFRGFIAEALAHLNALKVGSDIALETLDLLIFQSAMAKQAELATNDGDLKKVARANGLTVIDCPWA